MEELCSSVIAGVAHLKRFSAVPYPWKQAAVECQKAKQSAKTVQVREMVLGWIPRPAVAYLHL